ncbi:protein of unknown function [Burkholderia multivorans]
MPHRALADRAPHRPAGGGCEAASRPKGRRLPSESGKIAGYARSEAPGFAPAAPRPSRAGSPCCAAGPAPAPRSPSKERP